MRRLDNAIRRRGQTVPVYREQQNSTDEFGHEKTSWTQVDSVLTYRSYPNRNTTASEQEGPLNRDRPVFFFLSGNEPRSGDRVKYNGTWYELEAPTKYSTHVAMMANAATGFAP